MNEEDVKSHTSDLEDEISTRKLAEEKFINLYENAPDMLLPVDLIKDVMDNLPIGLAVNSVDPLVQFNYMNDKFPAFYRTTREALLIQDNFWNAVYEDPVFREEMRKRVLDDIASGNPERMHWKDIPITRKGEETTYVNAFNIQVPGKSLMISTVWDITERKQSELLILESQERLKEALDVSNRSRQTLLSVLEDQREAKNEVQKLNAELEQRVIERTLQLQAINKELETFTYSVSHDLKAPLRGIDGYSKLLSDLYKSSMNEEAQLFIETIRSSTLQMNQLIDDLLDYSRLERSLLTMECLKIKELIHSILELYRNELETGGFGIEMNIPDIDLIADRKGLTIALRNLLENAIKFSKGKSDPSIQIKVEENELSWILSVKDNGIGFDMKYHQKIFEIFQRLQRFEDFPGTGIGLAMVSKAMQRMHGRTWADSTPGMGSTFYLEIPKNQ